VPQSELLRFLAQVKADPALRQMMADVVTADEVSLLAQERGFLVYGTEILGFHGQSG
jgi:predicted ribosomally synthesized peptide with nif11-like leader